MNESGLPPESMAAMPAQGTPLARVQTLKWPTLVGALALGYVVFQLVSGAVQVVGLPTNAAVIALSTLLGEGTMVLIAWLMLSDALPWPVIGLGRRLDRGDLTWGAILIALSLILDVLATVILGMKDPRAQVAWAGSLAQTPALIGLTAAAVGFAEEIVFRGYLLAGLRAMWPRLVPLWVVVVSALFTLAHLPWGLNAVQIGVFFLSWLAVTVVTAWRRSLYPAILAHIVEDVIAMTSMAALAHH